MTFPEHWEVASLGQLGRFSKGGGGTKEDEVPNGVPCIRYGDLYSKYSTFITAARSFVSEDRSSAYTPVFYGDVLFAGSGETIEEIGKSAVNLLEGKACCGGDVLVFRPTREIDPRFLAYATDCPEAIDQKARMGRGVTVMHIYADELKHLRIAVPPLAEQAAIVRLLDHADRRIRRAIRAKQKLIALLNEHKQAVIHRAVTRGLDPNVPLKPSGVDWLGDVPEHWAVRRAKYAFRPIDVRSNTGAEELLTVSARLGVIPREGHNVTMFKAESYVGHKLCWPRDLVINSLWAWANGLGFSRHHGIVSTAYGVYRLRDEYTDHWGYLDRALRSGLYQPHFQIRSKGIWISRLQLTDWSFLDMPITLPPKCEARMITDRLDHETISQDRLIRKAEDEISLLREYRTRLIADAVTGKFDVREAAAHLPDEVGEPEPLDEIALDDSDESDMETLEPVEA